MTQPPVDPAEEPLGGALTPPPDEVPEPAPPTFEAPAAAEPPPAYQPPPAYPPPPPAYQPPPPPPAGSYPPPPPSAYPSPPPAPGGTPMAPPIGAYPPAFPPGSGAAYGAAAGLKPHRGGLLLTLGIASIVLSCGCIGLVLGIVTIMMANKDLAEIDAGIMDPAGRGNTRTGRTLGVVSIAVFVVALVFSVIFVLTNSGGS